MQIKFNKIKNMTAVQLIKSYKYCFDDNLKNFFRYKKLFKNYLHVILNIKKKNYPIKCILKTGNSLILNHHYEIMNIVIASHYEIRYDKENDFFSEFPNISKKDFKLYLGKGAGHGDGLLGDFYQILPVKDNIVIDIGANIGDSSIYFILHGAKKVIAIEPYPKNFETAKQNIEKNNFSDKINLILAGCSSKPSSIKINKNVESTSRSELVSSKEGLKIPLMTLEEIQKIDKSTPTILKIDCEGCEYDIILNSSKEILQKFSHIIIEYHYGYKNLKDKLEKYGFEVSVTEPRFAYNNQTYVGYLFAIKI